MKIIELHLYTNDLEETRDFYGRIMQFQITNENDQSFRFNAGESAIYFHEIKNEKPVYHFAFHIPNNKLQEAINWVSERTPVLPYSDESLIAEFKNWNAQSFYFHDNNSNILEFITHYDRQILADDPFSIHSINHVIEIGLPAKNVLETCNKIKEDHGIDFYAKGPVTENFAVMGDEDGMMILTKEGNTWLPVNQIAERFKSEMILEMNSKKIKIEIHK